MGQQSVCGTAICSHTLMFSSCGAFLPADPQARGSQLLLNIEAQPAPCPGLP